MSKKIGNFTNPVTGENDWLEPDTVHMLVLHPTMVTKVGDTFQSAIEYALSCSKDEEQIFLTAKYTSDSHTYESEPEAVSSLEFATEFMEIVYGEKSLDEHSELIKRMKAAANQNLTAKLMDNNILMGGMDFNGFGHITVDGDIVMTIESMAFNYSVEGNTANYSGQIRNCVGLVSLENLENPKITFWTGKYEIQFIEPVVKEATESVLKHYDVTMSNIMVRPEETMPVHEQFDAVNYNDELELERFIQSRKALLSDLSEKDNDLDDRMNDIFN